MRDIVSMMTKFVCVLLAAVPAVVAQGVAQGVAQVIEGTVSNSLGGAPIDGASVSIEQGGKATYQATTDAAGAFRIEGVKDGSYTARFSKRGFQPPARDAAARKPFRVAAGGDPVRLRVQMAPNGRVSGRVLDGDGRPVAGAAIELLFANSFAGNTDTSKEDGSFSFANVEPGSYTLNARPGGKIKPPVQMGDQVRGWARTYYPGVLDQPGAARIMVRPGAELPGPDIRLIAVPMHAVRGRVLDPKGDPAAGINVKLAAADEYPAEEAQSVSDEDGRFEFQGVRDGSWRLFVETAAGGVKLQAFTLPGMLGHDLDHQDLPLRPPFTLRGRVEFQAPAGFQGKQPLVSVTLAPPSGWGLTHGNGNTDQAGNFKIDGVFEGAYRVMAIGGEGIGSYYLASMMLGEREVLAQSFELAPNSLPLRIVYRSNGGTVRGTVEDCAGAGVVLVPQDPGLRRFEFIRRATCNEGGRYEIPQVRPGDYAAFAFDDAPDALDALLRFTQALVTQAVNVTVRPGEAVSADLKVTAVN